MSGFVRLGLFGGSFDPVHTGHIRLAAAAKEACALDRIVILPAACSPFKTGTFSSDEDRLAMCRLSFPGDGYEISPYEIEKGGVSYTVETVSHFRAAYPRAALTLILGEDQLLSFHKWYRFRDILANASLCAAVRTGDGSRRALEDYADAYLRPYGGVRVMAFEPFPVSSTDIREKVRRGDPIDGLVSPETEQYILEKGLYFGL